MLDPTFFYLLVGLLATNTTDYLPSSLGDKSLVTKLGASIIGNVQDANYVETNIHNHPLMDSIKSWSHLYEHSGSHVESDIHTMLNLFLRKDEIPISLENQKEQLFNAIDLVNGYHRDALKYGSNDSHSSTTKLEFTDRILLGQRSLPRLLVEIHDIFNFNADKPHGFLSLLEQSVMERRPSDCERSVSPQQLLYSLYTQLIIIELTSLATLRHVYTLRASIVGPTDNYAVILNGTKSRFENRIRDYHRLFSLQMPKFTKHLYRCNVDAPIRGIDFIEFQKFSRIQFLKTETWKPNCFSCPHPLMIREFARQLRSDVFNCKVLGHRLEVCPAEAGSIRHYLWLKDEAGNYYGHQTPCPDKKIIDAGQYIYSKTDQNNTIVIPCVKCACTVEDKWGHDYDEHEVVFINDEEQISDIWNNKVVTGVKFIVRERAIMLQIQESKFTGMELIHRDTAWKEVRTKYFPNGTVGGQPISLQQKLSSSSKTIILDDLIVPEGFAVTGVQLRKIGYYEFSFRVHATKFDFKTGRLDPSTSFWCESPGCNNAPKSSDYKRERIEIYMGEADDPTRGTAFNYDPETNKKIRLTHTDLHKDGGQTTIPFLDARPVHVQPVFPLSGIGLYFRGMEGFGGYIAPRIFTFDLSRDVLV